MGIGERVGQNVGERTGVQGAQRTWQLAAGHYYNLLQWPATAYASQTATTTQPYVIYPRPDSETGVSPVARHRWAHGSMDYEIPICVRGGAFPYLMQIDFDNTSSALTGITIGPTFDATNAYILSIPQSTINGLSTATDYDVYVMVTDQTGKVMKVWWSFQKEATELTHFFFVDNSYTGGTADGKYSTPFKSFNVPNYLNAGSAGNSAGKILVIKEGNSQTPGSEYDKTSATNGAWNISSTQFPVGIINIPGEQPVIDLNSEVPLFGLLGGGTADDVFVRGCYVENGWDCGGASSIEGYGAFMNSFGGASDRLCMSDMVFDTVTSWPTAGNTNNGCLTLSGHNSRIHHAYVNLEFKNITGPGLVNTGGAMMFMGCKWALIDNWNIHDFGTGSGCENLLYAKHATTDYTWRRITAYDNVNWTAANSRAIGINDEFSATGYENENIEICYCNMKPSASGTGYQAFFGFQTGHVSDGPIYFFRNTMVDTFASYSIDAPTWFYASVHTRAHNTSAADNLTIDSTETQTTLSDHNADGTLTDTWLSTNSKVRGELGHEIA